MRLVVYTGIFGTNEQLQELLYEPPEEIDHICLTDQAGLKSSSWKIRQVPEIIPGDSPRTTRFYKFLGSEEIRSYDFCLWVDNKIQFREPPRELFRFAEEAGMFGVARHDHRRTVAEEFEAVLRLRKDHPFLVEATRDFLKANMPEVFSEQPFSGTMLLRANTGPVLKAMEDWWMLVLRFSSRDQLTLNYVLARHDISTFKLPISASGSPLHNYLTASAVSRKLNRISLADFPSLWRVANGLLKGSNLGRWVWSRASR